ncbi:uncharacterized protein LOC142353328 isoform X2 [Convolutriloba macropyga]|uniref:uncharacterized protein LOC142353328 isoform X2 n=1 Tax=Convolutriloba macropyga TaxID=536237 RepID=UPI003F51F84A
MRISFKKALTLIVTIIHCTGCTAAGANNQTTEIGHVTLKHKEMKSFTNSSTHINSVILALPTGAALENVTNLTMNSIVTTYSMRTYIVTERQKPASSSGSPKSVELKFWIQNLLPGELYFHAIESIGYRNYTKHVNTTVKPTEVIVDQFLADLSDTTLDRRLLKVLQISVNSQGNQLCLFWKYPKRVAMYTSVVFTINNQDFEDHVEGSQEAGIHCLSQMSTSVKKSVTVFWKLRAAYDNENRTTESQVTAFTVTNAHTAKYIRTRLKLFSCREDWNLIPVTVTCNIRMTIPISVFDLELTVGYNVTSQSGSSGNDNQETTLIEGFFYSQNCEGIQFSPWVTCSSNISGLENNTRHELQLLKMCVIGFENGHRGNCIDFYTHPNHYLNFVARKGNYAQEDKSVSFKDSKSCQLVPVVLLAWVCSALLHVIY